MIQVPGTYLDWEHHKCSDPDCCGESFVSGSLPESLDTIPLLLAGVVLMSEAIVLMCDTPLGRFEVRIRWTELDHWRKFEGFKEILQISSPFSSDGKIDAL